METKPSWFIGSHHSLSFSSDGTAIAATTKAANGPKKQESQVQFWETATGAATSSFERSLYVVFSPTNSDIAVLVRSESVHILKRDSFGRNTWGGQTRHNTSYDPGAVYTFDSDGKTILSSYRSQLTERDPTTWSVLRGPSAFHSSYEITIVVCCPNKPGWFIACDQDGQLNFVSKTDNLNYNTSTLKLHRRLAPIDSVRVSACAWSQDGKWIATGNDVGDIFLWNAGVPSSASFAMHLPRNRLNTTSKPTTSLVFERDSTALIIISGGYLSVWDIGKVEYVANSGLPDKAMNIALDGRWNRLAVVVDGRISIYELKLPEEKCQMDGKSSIPSELAKFDITDAVVKFDPEPYVGSNFDTYRGALKLDTPRIFQHVVAIKALRPASEAPVNAHGQKFENVRN